MVRWTSRQIDNYHLEIDVFTCTTSRKNGLDLADIHLLTGALDQALDVLHVIQDIDLFVARFSNYLDPQEFVQ